MEKKNYGALTIILATVTACVLFMLFSLSYAIEGETNDLPTADPELITEDPVVDPTPVDPVPTPEADPEDPAVDPVVTDPEADPQPNEDLYIIKGTVKVYGTSDPIEGVYVRFAHTASGFVSETYTDSEGKYQLNDIPESYLLTRTNTDYDSVNTLLFLAKGYAYSESDVYKPASGNEITIDKELKKGFLTISGDEHHVEFKVTNYLYVAPPGPGEANNEY